MQKILDVAERVKKDLTMVIAARQVFRPAASDNELIRCFNIGYASDAFNLVRHSLLFFQVMALMRLWDNRRDVHSILTLARLLSDGKLVAKLVERERQASHETKQTETLLGEGKRVLPLSASRSTPDQRERELRTRVSAWCQEVGTAKGQAEIVRLQNYRHDILAHSAGQSHRPLIPLPYYDDGQKALESTIPIVSEGFHLATRIDHDFSTTNSVWDVVQRDMWEIIRSAARGERYSPAVRDVEDLARELAGKGFVTIKG
jgi:hypothetical protein